MTHGSPRIVSSWGNVAQGEHRIYRLASRFDDFPDIPAQTSILPFGNGRSYGDSCLNLGGSLLETRCLDRFIRFDADRGTLACEAGVLLADILRVVAPAGWFPCVLPGTQYVTVGGAIANDVHGKNHHRAGTFGCHVTRFELLRPDGQRMSCSAEETPGWFAATIGGLGLTGVITWAQMRLRRVAGPWLDVESIRCADLDELLEVSIESAKDFEYTVAWIDCLARGRRLGRGILQRANHADGAASAQRPAGGAGFTVPFAPPVSLVNSATLRLFNATHYHRGGLRSRTVQHFQRFFFPLDGIRHWNRLYGPRGFHQYQCVIPGSGAKEAVRRLLGATAAAGEGSFLAVLKCFGDRASPGLLSFPEPGITLALDFPNRGAPLARLLERLDAIVADSGGRLYPAKDARMPAELFRAGYPRHREFLRFTHPRCSSSFWRRVMADA